VNGRFGLLGLSLSHSHSPMIHAEFGDYEYALYEKKPEEVEDFLLNGNFDGLNVTVPYKITAKRCCAVLSDTARAAGSVNTIIKKADGTLCGDNTDCFGFGYLLDKAGVQTDCKTIILGNGGSCLAIQELIRIREAIRAARPGKTKITVISRGGENNYENIFHYSDAEVIINTTPLGMYPNNGVSPLPDLSVFGNCRAVIDIIYNPLRTELMLLAQQRGILSAGGLPMLVAQAKKSSELFTKKTLPNEMIDAVTAKIINSVQNIILIGMPGCGKSTAGAALAKKTGREFIDADDEIIKAAKKPIEQIFYEDGEEAFRRYETEALEKICKRSGLIVATGGGAVTREKNKHLLKQNGMIFFLDRDISELPTNGRPLSVEHGVAALYEKRLPLYEEWCDVKIKANDSDGAVKKILAAFYK